MLEVCLRIAERSATGGIGLMSRDPESDAAWATGGGRTSRGRRRGL